MQLYRPASGPGVLLASTRGEVWGFGKLGVFWGLSVGVLKVRGWEIGVFWGFRRSRLGVQGLGVGNWGVGV